MGKKKETVKKNYAVSGSFEQTGAREMTEKTLRKLIIFFLILSGIIMLVKIMLVKIMLVKIMLVKVL